MFTWICPKCGTEVPPSSAECPACVQAAAPPPPPPPVVALPSPRPPAVDLPPPRLEARAETRPAEPVRVLPAEELPSPPPPSFGMSLPERSLAEPPPSGGMPSWLVAFLSLAAVAGLGFGIVYFIKEGRNGSAVTEAAAAVQNEATASAAAAHPLAKFIEVTGLRLSQERQRVALKFLVVNHSAGPLGGFDLEVDVTTVNAKPTDPPLFTIKTPIKNVSPMESRDFTVPVPAKLRAFDLPDWQFLRATFRVVNAD